MQTALRDQYLQVMGIQRWTLRRQTPVTDVETPAPGDALVKAQPESQLEALAWLQLQRTVEQCTRCELHKTRTQTVFGTGNTQARWLVIGEAPGADEDRQGEPFVGRAGQLLNEMLRAIQFQRNDVYIANILKCRPPGNRDPQPNEVLCCETYLRQQIKLINPGIILAVGRIAAQNLLKTDAAINRLRGRIHQLPDSQIPLIVTYHPAYLLRNPIDKRKAWEDLKLALSCKITEN